MDKAVVESICNYIKIKHKDLYESYNFKYKTQKHTLYDIIDAILYFIKISSSWRNFKYKNIKYNTIYKNYIKLNKYNIFENTYIDIIKRYLKKATRGKLKYIYTDTTTVYNKLNSDKVKRNKYFKNKNVIKLSFITDVNGVVINSLIESGNKHDSTIFINQINDIVNNNTKNIYKNSILLADSGYDSKRISNLKTFKKQIIKPNNRNTKNDALKRTLTKNEEEIYNKRIKIEHTNQKIKSYRRLNNIYERYVNNYNQLLYLALIHIFHKLKLI